MTKFYELTGKARTDVLQILADRDAVIAEINKLARSLDCSGWYYSGLFSDAPGGFKASKKKPVHPSLRQFWDKKRRLHTEVLVPNLSTKEGKALQQTLRKLSIPGRYEIGKLIGMQMIGPGLSVRTPGVTVYGPRKRLFVGVPNDITPKIGKRISDTAVERLEAADKPVRKKSTRARK